MFIYRFMQDASAFRAFPARNVGVFFLGRRYHAKHESQQAFRCHMRREHADTLFVKDPVVGALLNSLINRREHGPPLFTTARDD